MKHPIRSFKLLIWVLIPLILTLLLLACERDEVIIPEGAFTEHIVDLQGNWKINRVLLNGEEITDRFDFSGFELSLNMNGSGNYEYIINNASAPFVVTQSGNWTYNDPVYPTAIIFRSSRKEATANFAIPPISKDLEMSISFTLGCQDNLYIYEFSKQAN